MGARSVSLISYDNFMGNSSWRDFFSFLCGGKQNKVEPQSAFIFLTARSKSAEFGFCKRARGEGGWLSDATGTLVFPIWEGYHFRVFFSPSLGVFFLSVFSPGVIMASVELDLPCKEPHLNKAGGGGGSGSTTTTTTARTTSTTTTATGCSATSVAVTFNELVTTSYGQTIKM